jgi:predicted Rdx family selenoprotein
MKRNKFALLVLSMVAVLTLASFIMHMASAQQPQAQQNPADDSVKMRDAFRRGGYREAAKIKGRFNETVDPNWDFGLFDIEALAKKSVAVIVGVPSNNASRLSAAGDLITTVYEVTAQDVIKGNISPGSTLKVGLLGGTMRFEDGTIAEVETPGFERMSNGKTYLLFLYANKNGDDVLLLTGGPQGLFELPGDGKKVKAHGRATDPAVKQAKDKDQADFLKEVRQQAEKWPQAGDCCS